MVPPLLEETKSRETTVKIEVPIFKFGKRVQEEGIILLFCNSSPTQKHLIQNPNNHGSMIV